MGSFFHATKLRALRLLMEGRGRQWNCLSKGVPGQSLGTRGPLQKSFSLRKPKACYNRSRWLSARSGARYHRNLTLRKTNPGGIPPSVLPLPG